MRNAFAIGLCSLALPALAAPVGAYWRAGGSGSGAAAAAVMPTADRPAVKVSGRDVTVSWTQNSFQDSPIGAYGGGGYRLKRYALGSSTAATPQSCDMTISGTSATLECTDRGAPAGDWQYSVQPVLKSFLGEEGPRSPTVTVTAAAPKLSFSSSTTITILPTTLLGG